MADAITPKIQDAADVIGGHMDAILKVFKPGMKITVLVRNPNKPDGTQDFVLSDDELVAAIAALQIRADPKVKTLRGGV